MIFSFPFALTSTLIKLLIFAHHSSSNSSIDEGIEMLSIEEFLNALFAIVLNSEWFANSILWRFLQESNANGLITLIKEGIIAISTSRRAKYKIS